MDFFLDHAAVKTNKKTTGAQEPTLLKVNMVAFFRNMIDPIDYPDGVLF